ncbi:hypothetical protein [Salinivibrio sp. KP-1]|uniref:hypothetical protein n=1 Tax=Salinivibrio sp. KP-1 TaxID=1406902 RepID=UPI0006145ED9|nr:hypothetical protein [Salinivibrio sp. KP-1]KKA43419.1 hypothetical protein WN56_13605 [Salinivibrio sp. KP-1]
MYLLITNKQDVTMDFIVQELERRCLPYLRLNTEDIASYFVSFGVRKNDWQLEYNGTAVSGKNISAAYFRRPGNPEFDDLAEHEDYVRNEWLAALKSLYWRMKDKFLNSPSDILLSEDKPRQLSEAYDIGFNLPGTIITNNFEKIAPFQKEFSLIAKPLRQAILGDESVVFTSSIGSVSAKDSSKISVCPCIFQQEIAKKYDLRITIVGENAYPVAIHSQTNLETKTDWRKGGYTDIKHTLVDIPSNIKNMCIALTKRLGLRFSAIDLIVDNNNTYWFLEINPNGQWAWIENQTKAPISKAIVDELVEISHEH